MRIKISEVKMNRRYLLVMFFIVLIALAYVSCGPTIKVETPKPIEINVNVRIDVYNHVAAVEDSIYGEAEKQQENKQTPSGGQSLIRQLFMQPACAASDDSQYNAAKQRRTARASDVIKYKNEGSLGENHFGLVSVIDSPKVKSDKNYASKVRKLVKEENADREIMYKYDAQSQGVSVDVVKEQAARVHRDRDKSGWWIEVKQGNDWVWKQK